MTAPKKRRRPAAKPAPAPREPKPLVTVPSQNSHPVQEKMRWVGVVRVSTSEQEGGVATQRHDIEAWVKARQGTLVAIFVDEVTGTMDKLSDRHALTAAFEALGANAADGIVLWKLDRLARDLVLQELMLRDIWKLGGIVASTFAEEERLLDDDGSDPTRTLIRQILGAFAQYERAGIRIRTAAGRARAKNEGRYLGGTVPYGFVIDPISGQPVHDAREVDIIGEALTMRDVGCSLTEIAEFLLQAGMPPRQHGTHRHARETVRHILREAPKRGISPRALGALGRQFAGDRALIYESTAQ